MNINRFNRPVTKLSYSSILLFILILHSASVPRTSAQTETADADSILGPNIAINGNFETPDVTSVTYDSYFSGQSFGGWTIESGSIDHISQGYWQAADGRQSIDLDGTCGVGAGIIYQDLVLPLLQTYFLRFAMSGNPEG